MNWIEMLRPAFSERDMARGIAYWQEERVREVRLQGEHDGLRIESSVRGSGHNVYTTDILMRHADRQLHIEASCSCPLGSACKHIVATCIEALEENAAADWLLHSRQGGISGAARLWLEQVREATQRPADSPECLIYTLDPSRLGRGWLLRIHKTRRLKNGSLAASQPYNNFRHVVLGAQRPAFIHDNDEQVLRLARLIPDSLGSYEGVSLAGAQGFELLQAALASGRCHWQSPKGPLLRCGAARQAGWTWQTLAGTLQIRPDITGPGHLLNLQPACWLDNTQHSLHPLQLPGDAKASRLLLQAPALPAEEWADILPQLGNLLQRAAANTPPGVVASTWLDSVLPRPCLRLFACTLAYGRLKRDYVLAELTFAYADQRIAPRHPQNTLSAMQHGQRVLIQRQPKAEQAVLQELRKWPFLLDELGWQAPPDARRDCYVLPAGEQLAAFMLEYIPTWQARGWQIELDPSLPLQLADIDEHTHWQGTLQEQEGWFGVGLDLVLNGQQVNIVPLLLQALKALPLDTQQAYARGELPEKITVRHQKNLLQLPVTRIRPLLELLLELYQRPQIRNPLGHNGTLQLARLDAARLSADRRMHWHDQHGLQQLGEKLAGFAQLSALPAADGFAAQLREYQQHGLAWLHFLRDYGFGGILADDMGLGKTVQTLAFVHRLKQQEKNAGPVLIVCPTSLLANWRHECQRFAPELHILTLNGNKRSALLAQISQADIVLTSYALLQREHAALAAEHFALVVFDEAQNLKNAKTKQSAAARSLNAKQKLALSGTPMENHLGELWSLFDLLMPGFLADEKTFRQHYRNPIEKKGDTQCAQQLLQRVRPFMLRRTKDLVASELPAKTEIIRRIDMGGVQRDLYETIRATMDEKMRTVMAKKGLARSHIEMLDALLKLRQTCCDPRLLKQDSARQAESAKLLYLVELLSELLEEGRHILLFSQFTSMLELIEEILQLRQIDYVKLTGNTRDRETPIKRFQSGEARLFLISLKAGGTGLNLTAADCVIHYDPWWNPAVETQASDRAYRIGQDKPVFVYKLICADTVEERIVQLQDKKRSLADAVYGDHAGLDSLLTEDDVRDLFAPMT